jgi:hypothetical protein
MSKRCIKPLICLFMLLMTSCDNFTSADNVHFMLRMERVLCDGECPAYALTIYSDGTVFYEGYRYVDLEGNAQTKLSNEQIQALLEEINRSNILTENQDCCRSSTKGAPSVTFTINLNWQSSYVGYMLTDNTKVPVELRHLECYIDEITNSTQWTGEHSYCDTISE